VLKGLPYTCDISVPKYSEAADKKRVFDAIPLDILTFEEPD
jgi:hypothetical protein